MKSNVSTVYKFERNIALSKLRRKIIPLDSPLKTEDKQILRTTTIMMMMGENVKNIIR